MKYFIKRLAGFSLGPILGAAISFILFPIFINLLPVGEYGRAGGFQSLLVQLPTFIYLGLDQAYTREFNHHDDKKYLIQQAMLPSLAMGALVTVIMSIFARPIAQWSLGNADYYYIVIASMGWVIITIIERFVQLHIRMEEHALEYSLFTLSIKIGIFIATLGLIFLGIRDFRVVIYGLLLGTILADSILFYRYRHLLDFRGYNFDPALIRQLFAFGLPIMMAVSLSALLNLMDIIFLQSYSDFRNLGIYKAGSQLAAILGIMKTAFTSFWIPTAYRWYHEERDIKHYAYISDLILMFMSLIYFGLLLLKYPITFVLNPSREYLELMYIVGLLAFPHLMYTLSETTTLGIVFSKRTGYNVVVSLLSLIVSATLNGLLTPTFGYRGAAVASSVAYFVFYLARTYFSWRTGFYFSQVKQLSVATLMLIAGIMNLYERPSILLWTALFAVVALVIQIPTFKTTYQIYQAPDEWDFT